MARRQKPRTQFGRTVREVIETDERRIAFTHVCAIEKDRRGRRRNVVVASTYNGQGDRVSADPRIGIARAIRAALDPNNARQACETLATMSPEKRAEMERLYGKKSGA